jgi:superfamily II DNA or RNA helicase
VRDPRLTPATTQPLPSPAELSFLEEQSTEDVDLHLGTSVVFDMGAVTIPSVENELAPSVIERLGKPEDRLDLFPDLGPFGGLFTDRSAYDESGPYPIRRSYRPIWEQGDALVVDAPTRLELMQPLLEPSVLTPETSPLVLPRPLRKEQIEAINALHGGEAILFADDVGAGKFVTACVALTALIQKGDVKRVLIATTKGGLRTVARTLADWAPGVITNVVHGQPEIRVLDWETRAHVYLTDYETLAEDLESSILDGDELHFDLVILEGVHTTGLHFQQFPGPLMRLVADRRWALAGALPEESEDWLALFRFLTPEKVEGTGSLTLPDVRRRFRPYMLRRTKAELADELPRIRRQEVWLDLDPAHKQAYEEAIAEERHRLSKMGSAVTSAHIHSAIDRIKAASNFPEDSLNSAKVRALIDLVEQIAASDSKIIVFSHFRESGLERLHPILEPYGVLLLDSEANEDRRTKILESFRNQEHWHVLLMEMGARTDGDALVEASYIAHFDHSWNPAHRLRAEARLYPDIFTAIPVNIYEFWMADTIDERLHRFLAHRGLLPGDVPQGTRPSEIEDRLTIANWMDDILEVPAEGGSARVTVKSSYGTGILPGTSVLRSKLSELSPDTLIAAVETLIKALGYPEVEPLDEPDQEGGYLIAWREDGEEIERVLVRCIRTHNNVGVAKARALLKAMETRRDCMGAYLVTTTDFTASCKNFADDSDGRLALVSGAELYRHLHILGRS